MALLEEAFPPYEPFGSRTLSGGETGTDVALLQLIYDLMLQAMNPPQGPMGPAIAVTGVYDAATAAAVAGIQSYFGISADGIAGPATYWIYGQGVGPFVTYGGPAYGSRTLSSGSRGGDITVLQNRLNCFRYSTALGRPADGVYGGATATAVREFQSDANEDGDSGVPTNGVVGAATAGASWLYTFAGGRGLFAGRNGFDVVWTQTLLRDLRLYTGPIHGYYDGPTQRAVVAFQTGNGLVPDGVVGPSTFHAFGQVNMTVAPFPLPIPAIPPSPTPTPTPTPPPSPSGTVCSLLTPAVLGSAAVGASVVICATSNVAVFGYDLPTPDSYGAQYDRYAAVAGLTSSGATLQWPLGQDPQGNWAGDVTTYLDLTQGGTAAVRPSNSQAALGPVVLQGALPSC